jgi:hypothetical protein
VVPANEKAAVPAGVVATGGDSADDTKVALALSGPEVIKLQLQLSRSTVPSNITIAVLSTDA